MLTESHHRNIIKSKKMKKKKKDPKLLEMHLFSVLFSFSLIATLAERLVTIPPNIPFTSPQSVRGGQSRGSWVTFSNSSSALTLSTPLFCLSLSASQGSLLSLIDIPTAETLFYGSAYDQLWALVGPSGSLNNNALPFSWTWQPGGDGGGELVLNWVRTGGLGEKVRVTVAVPNEVRWFDMTFEMLSAPSSGTGAIWDSLWFPSMALVNLSSERAGTFFPILPGLTLNSSFFSAGVPTNLPYPGGGMFAELIHFSPSPTVSVSLATISGPNLTIPHFKGLYPASSSGEGLWRYAHSISPVNVTDGCDPQNGGWGGTAAKPTESYSTQIPPPCALGLQGSVRVRIAVNGSVFDDVMLYGVSNGLLPPPTSWSLGNSRSSSNTTILTPYGSNFLPSLLSKVPPTSNSTPSARLRALARGPFVKVDAVGLGLNFSEYPTKLLAALAPLGPGLILHSVAWEPVAFDHFYPDLLPPNPRFGSGCTFQTALQALSQAGHLSVPYSNPTWWDPSAPTLSGLPSPLTLSSVSTLNSSLQPVFETYPDVPPATGIVTQLSHPFVAARIRSLLCQLDDTLTWPECVVSSSGSRSLGENAHGDGPCNETAVRLQNAMQFEDQLGARHALADENPLAGGLGALGFQESIQRHSFNVTTSGVWGGGSGGVFLGTEQGYDRLALHVGAFFGHQLELNPTSYPFYGRNWTPNPVSGVLLGHSVLYAVHNLDTAAFAKDLPQACWAMATGARLSIDGVDAYWNPNTLPWLASVATMQRHVVSQWTGYSTSSFVDLLGERGESLTVGTGASFTNFTSPLQEDPPLFPGASKSYGVFANWANVDPLALHLPFDQSSSSSSSTMGDFVLPPRGCLAFGDEGDVLGGWVSTWRGRSNLSSASPFVLVVEDRNCNGPAPGKTGVCLRSALGGDLTLEVAPVTPCTPSIPPTCTYISHQGVPLGPAPCVCALTTGLVSVTWVSLFAGSPVDYVFVPGRPPSSKGSSEHSSVNAGLAGGLSIAAVAAAAVAT